MNEEGMRYKDIKPGEMFVFDYSHHGKTPYIRLYLKLEKGFVHIRSGEYYDDVPDAMPLDCKVIQ